MYSLVNQILLPLVTNLIAGFISGYIVARYFEFRLIIQRAEYALRLFARDQEAANHTLDELQVARDQLFSHGFPSARGPLNEIIEWAKLHMGDGTLEVDEKRKKMMPLLENLRPRFLEMLRLR